MDMIGRIRRLHVRDKLLEREIARRRIWIEAARRRFGSFVELNAWVGERYQALWNDVRGRSPRYAAAWVSSVDERHNIASVSRQRQCAQKRPFRSEVAWVFKAAGTPRLDLQPAAVRAPRRSASAIPR